MQSLPPSPATRKTRPLRRGGRAFVIAPSSPFPDDRLTTGIDRLTASGFDVERAPALLRRTHAYLNGTDAERLSELQTALESDVDAVWLARGGYGLGRIIDQLSVPPGVLPTVVGFSDATVLLSHLLTAGVPSVHGPLATSVGAETDASYGHLLDVLAQTPSPLRPLVGRAVRPLSKAVEGWLYPANLCVLSHLVGTASLPSLKGAIVVLEEVGERPYRIDRMLTQLFAAGVFDGVAAIAVGHLTGCEEPSGSAVPAPAPLAVFAERTRNLPLVGAFEVGHEAPNFALRVGSNVTLVPSNDDDTVELVFEDHRELAIG